MDDLEIRLAAFDHLSKLTRIKGEVLSWDLLTQPFELQGEKILLANRARGIFQDRKVISIPGRILTLPGFECPPKAPDAYGIQAIFQFFLQ